ncbi:daptide-type RiPP biosynthesis methyltransferase [Nocardioides lijunqiniae]|uniref:daptide-type RiPP biosynthesis methyltransferase n=1 Tax=Nocardioides lijunqiniae TaxID=2760832 RepID=UPI0018775545|nr:daptide-type RiPP biosynthesis methyltransferase [Nocardioides lijunqiniae]
MVDVHDTVPDTGPGAAFQEGGSLHPLGSLATAVAELGDRARLCDLYDFSGAPIYDDCYGVDAEEVAVLRDVLRRVPGPVLELAAGNGRLTLPLLQMGREVTALDLSAGMLAQLEGRVSVLRERIRSRLHIQQGDMTVIDLPDSVPQEYGLVVLLLASISILDRDGRVAVLRRARERLSPGGAVLFSIVVTRSEDTDVADHVHETTGRSGQGYRIHEVRQQDTEIRQVGIYPVIDDPTVAVPVGIGVHRVLDLDGVLAEVAEAGLTLRSQHVVDSPLQGLAEVFLEAFDATVAPPSDGSELAPRG